MKASRQMFAAVAVFAVLFAAGSGVKYEVGPYDWATDTLGVASGDSVSRAYPIMGAMEVGLYVPTLTAGSLILRVGFDADSTFHQHAKESIGGDTLKVWTLHNGTGAFGVDITEWVTGFPYFQVETGGAQAALRTFHVVTKW